MTPTFGQFWDMATEAGFQMRGRNVPSGRGDTDRGVMIEMIPLPRKGDRKRDITARVERAIDWIIANGGVCDPAVEKDGHLVFRGAILGMWFTIQTPDIWR